MKLPSTAIKKSTSSRREYEYFGARVMLLIFKIMGHAPLSIVRRSSKEKSPKAIAVAAALTTTNFAHSGAGSVYNVILIVLLVGLNFVSVPLLYEGEYLSKTPFTETIEVTQAVGGNAVVVFIWLLNLLRQKTMVKIINRLMNVDATVFRLTETNRNYFVLLFLTNFSVWILLIVSNQQSYHTAVLGFMNEIVPGVIINWFMIQYVVTVKLIEKRFSALNRALLDSPTSSIVVPIRSLILGCVSADDIDFPNVLSFRRAHSDLYEISCQVAEFYSLPIVFAIAFGCFSIIYNAYWVVVPFVFVSEDEPTFMIVNAISWLGAWMLPITTLALAINAVTAQIKNTAHCVHKLLARSTISPGDKLELKAFSLDLLQREVQFTASGLFPLDCTLVQSIFSMVVTYIIILFQFQMANDTTR